MKKVLFAGFLVLAGVSVSAQNLIKNEKFATEVKTKVTNANKATAGEWFIMNNEADGVTTIAWEETGDAKYPNAMKLDNSGAEKNLSWYKAFLGQRITDGLDKGIYVLTFYAKAKEAGTPVSVYIKQILAALNENGIKDIEEANAICEQYGLDPYKTCEETQPICFENAKWAYVVGCAIALKKGCKNAAEAAEAIGIGLQSFCIPGSVADDRKVGLGHGNLAAMLLREETKCFAFLAGHESFAAAEGAIKIAAKADKVRKEPLRCILNGLGKDAAQIISRINGFTYVQTQFDYYTGELKVVQEIAYSDGPRAKVKCYGADDVREGVAIMWKEGVDVSITGNSTNPTRFQHPVAGTYKKERVLAGKPYFSVASGGGTGRTLHPDNMAAGPASYGMTDTMGRMHSDAQFAGSSSVPAHVEMMGFLGIGNNPMVGCTVACAVDVATALNK